MNRRIPEPDLRSRTVEVPAGGPAGASGAHAGRPDPGRRQLLVHTHVPMVGRMAKAMLRRTPAAVDYRDLVSAGTVGLLEAIERFDPDRGVTFGAYASARIRGAMLDELRAGTPVARGFWSDRRRVEDAVADLTLRHGREPGVREIAAEAGLSAAAVERVRARAGAVAVTLDDVPEDAPALRDRSWTGDPETAAARAESRDRLRWALDLLPDRSRDVVRRYYAEGMTFARIAHDLHVTQSRVAQLHAQALRRLRVLLTEAGTWESGS